MIDIENEYGKFYSTSSTSYPFWLITYVSEAEMLTYSTQKGRIQSSKYIDTILEKVIRHQFIQI